MAKSQANPAPSLVSKSKQGQPSSLIKPPVLRQGARVGLVCPGSRPYQPSTVKRAVEIVEQMGFKPVIGKHVLPLLAVMTGRLLLGAGIKQVEYAAS